MPSRSETSPSTPKSSQMRPVTASSANSRESTVAAKMRRACSGLVLSMWKPTADPDGPLHPRFAEPLR